jgi:hypothetical protein
LKQKNKPAASTGKKSSRIVEKPNHLERLELFLAANERKVFAALLFTSMLFALLLFNARMSVSGDDASYIERGWDFLHEGKYPYFQGPGYPLFLSVFLKLFGLNIVLLKLTSTVCYFPFLWFTYKAFRNRIPFTVLFMLLSFIGLNNFYLYYASQTYTETFFMAIQSFCIYTAFSTIDAGNKFVDWKTEARKNIFRWLLLGFSFLILYISKSIGFVSIPALVLFLIIKKDYRHAAFAVISFGFFLLIYTFITSSLYGPQDMSQLEMMLRKDIYHPENGLEDFSGMISRFSGNFLTYIGIHALRIMNLKNTDPTVFEIDILVLILSVSFFLFSIYRSFRLNKYVFYSSVYAVSLCTIIFFGVQISNTQDRLIIVVMPLIFLVSSFVIYEFAKSFMMSRLMFTAFTVLMFLITIVKSVNAISKNIPSLEKNLQGDIYYGYTPDWQNYLKVSRFCADSLPTDAVVLSRKPSNSFIYARGKKFEGQFYVSTKNADSAIQTFKKRKIHYVILASLRVNPNVNDGRYINTIHRMVEPIYSKDQEKFTLIKSIGDTEPAAVYEINY